MRQGFSGGGTLAKRSPGSRNREAPIKRPGPLDSGSLSRILSGATIHLNGAEAPRDRVLRDPAAYLDLSGPGHRSCLALHRVGFARPPRHRDAGALLPHLFTIACASHEVMPSAVSFLWHFPAGFPGWELPTTLPFSVRTFLEGYLPRDRVDPHVDDR